MITSILTVALGMGSPVAPGAGMTFSSGGRDGKDILEAIQATERSLQNTQTFGLRNRILGILHSELKSKYGINGWNGYIPLRCVAEWKCALRHL